MVLAFFSAGTVAIAATCPLREIKPVGNLLRIDGYVITLKSSSQDEGDPGNPPAWEDGMSIAGPDGKSCPVDIAIISPPFFLAGSHLLYVDTYSGSEDTQFLVDIRNCGGTWSSPQYVGPPKLVGPDRMYYEAENTKWGDAKNDSFTVTVGPDCLPGKPVYGK